MKRILIYIFSFFTVVLPGSAQRMMTLSECIGQALDANYGIRIAVNNEQINRNNRNYGVFLPTLSASASQRESTVDSKRTDSNGTERKFNNTVTDNLSASVNLNWRIFDGLAMFTTHARLKEIVSRGELETRLAVEKLIAQVSTGYYNILVQTSLLKAAKQTLELSEQRFNVAMQKYKIGNLSGLELKQTKIDLNADSSSLVEQQEALRSAYINLNTLMNTELKRVDYVKDSIVLLPMLQYEDIQDRMLADNTSLEIARRDKKISELDLKLARSAFFPTVDFQSGYSFSRSDSPQSITTFSQSNGLFWGFSMNLPIFDKLENSRKLKNSKVELKNNELNYQDLELQMKSDLAQLYNSYENSLLMVSFESESAEVAYETLQAAMERYRLGDLSGIEFREFQRSYVSAVTRKLTAEFQAKTAEISLMLLSGGLRM
ncbi:MAG: TolC family protein [Bacteroidaceae bacterium]|nr:TolC family protein [Bacteroidaceae bacterium]